jgi:hypothetical protein
MPAGPSEFGFVYFVAAKYAGYTAFSRWILAPRLGPADSTYTKIPSPFFGGLVRTLIGVGVGALVGLGFWKIPAFESHSGLATTLFFVLLIPLRIGEWWVLLKTVYREFRCPAEDQTRIIVMGIFTSFCLDALGILAAFILPGGMWVC